MEPSRPMSTRTSIRSGSAVRRRSNKIKIGQDQETQDPGDPQKPGDDGASGSATPSLLPAIVSRYDERAKRFANAKLLSNKVHVQWYRRYVDVIPEETDLYFQPFDEIQKRDEDIALQYYYGKDYRSIADRTDNESKVERAIALRRYYKMLQVLKDRAAANVSAGVSKKPSMVEQDVREMFGITDKEKRMVSPVIAFFQKLHQKRNRIARRPTLTLVKKETKWELLHNPIIKLKIKALLEEMRRLEIRKKFTRIINLVKSVQKFLYGVSVQAGDTQILTRKVRVDQIKFEEIAPRVGAERFIFHPERYKLQQTEEMPMQLKMALTKPWHTRNLEEIQLIVDHLQKMKSFVAYPVSFQKLLATTAWYLDVPPNRVIIRQRHVAMDFYFILSGRARMEKLVGSPDYREASKFEFVGLARKFEIIGEECTRDPDSCREYSVIADTYCEMLSVSLEDLHNVTMFTKDQEYAPEHLRFLSNLKFLNKFPKVKLLQEAAGNLNLFHFVNDTLVTGNLEKSAFVYIISYGSCAVLVEIPPSARVIARHEKAKLELAKRKPPNIPASLPPIIQQGRKSFLQTIEREVQHNRSLAKKCEREIRRRSTNIVEQTSELLDSTRVIKEKLSRTKARSFHSISDEMDTPGRHRSDPKSVLKFSLEDVILNEKASLPSATSVVSFKSVKSDGSEGESRPTRKSSLIVGSNMDFEDAAKKAFNLRKRSHIHVEHETGDVTSTGPIIRLKSEHDDGSDCFSIQLGKRDLEDICSVDSTASPEQLNTVSSSSSVKHKDSTASYQHSQWKVKKMLFKGDVVGPEWLDYNDGPYTPPKEVWSLVSHGATVIMIRKTLLLKYLRKTW